MSEQTEVDNQQVDQTEAEALASAMAGYNARGANTPPAEEQAEQQAQQGGVEQANVQEEPPVAEVQQPEVPAEPSLDDELAALKAKVRALQDERGHEAVRKLNGEVGAITRRLKELETKQPPAEAPVDDELAAAIIKAEEAAKDFPDLAGPIVDALKVAAKAKVDTGKPALSAEEISALAKQSASEAAQQARVQAAQEALTEEHPDWEQVRETAGFQAWLKAKPVEYRERLETTWNPLVVAKGLTDYKDSVRQQQQVKDQKQNRLASAVTPRGVPTPPNPSKLPDEAGFMAGYNRGAPRPLHKR